MDEDSVSFQLFLIPCLSLYLVQKAKLLCSSYFKAILRCLVFLWGGEHAQKPKFEGHFARFNFSRLSLAFILKYYPILHVVKR